MEDSEYHKEAEAILDSLSKWIIPVIVIHELVWFLKEMKLEDRLNDVITYLQHQKSEIVCDCSDNVIEATEILKREKNSPFQITMI